MECGRTVPSSATCRLTGPMYSRLAVLQRVALVASLAVCLSSCVESPPPIGRDLPTAYADARPTFNRRVSERFPLGTSEQELLTELGKEGFTRNPARLVPAHFQASATYKARRFPCDMFWTINWSRDSGKITAVDGDYGATCL